MRCSVLYSVDDHWDASEMLGKGFFLLPEMISLSNSPRHIVFHRVMSYDFLATRRHVIMYLQFLPQYPTGVVCVI